MKIAVVYWSGTGNTKMMAEMLAESLGKRGAEASLIEAVSFSASDVQTYDAFAFGCPAMGSEVLEEDEFEPMFASVESALSGKRIVLFGSYGWGDGEWMREWEARAEADGAAVAGTVIANGEPDSAAEADLDKLGGALVE